MRMLCVFANAVCVRVYQVCVAGFVCSCICGHVHVRTCVCKLGGVCVYVWICASVRVITMNTFFLFL